MELRVMVIPYINGNQSILEQNFLIYVEDRNNTTTLILFSPASLRNHLREKVKHLLYRFYISNVS